MTFLRRVSLLGAVVLCAGLISTSLASGATLGAAGGACPALGASETLAATSITSTTAVLNGRYAFAGGGGGSRYNSGLTAAYGTTVLTGQIGPGGNTPDPVTVSGLTPSTTYHFRYVHTLGLEGCDLTFTTLAAPSPAAPAPAPGSESADMLI